MKTLTKVLLILAIVICAFMSMPQNKVYARTEEEKQTARNAITSITDNIVGDPTNAKKYTGDLANTINTIVGFLQIASGMAAIISLVMLGFNYITSGSSELKKDVLAKFWPILIGFILVFGASTIVKFVIGVA